MYPPVGQIFSFFKVGMLWKIRLHFRAKRIWEGIEKTQGKGIACMFKQVGCLFPCEYICVWRGMRTCAHTHTHTHTRTHTHTHTHTHTQTQRARKTQIILTEKEKYFWHAIRRLKSLVLCNGLNSMLLGQVRTGAFNTAPYLSIRINLALSFSEGEAPLSVVNAFSQRC